MTTSFQWLPEYSVNVKEIDEQHQHFVGIINEFYDAVQKRQDPAVLGKILDELVAYKEFHFATEEKYFDMFNYELAAEHKAQHQDLRRKVEEFKQNFVGHELEQAFLLIDFLENWLVVHLGEMDKKYTKCFNEHGLY